MRRIRVSMSFSCTLIFILCSQPVLRVVLDLYVPGWAGQAGLAELSGLAGLTALAGLTGLAGLAGLARCSCINMGWVLL
jgi:hypothetical protein